MEGEDVYGWQREYYRSLNLELYEEPLQGSYAAKKMNFGQTVLDVMLRSNEHFETCYLIGLIEVLLPIDAKQSVKRRILINPGESC
jgi:hypothetical protein